MYICMYVCVQLSGSTSKNEKCVQIEKLARCRGINRDVCVSYIALAKIQKLKKKCLFLVLSCKFKLSNLVLPLCRFFFIWFIFPFTLFTCLQEYSEFWRVLLHLCICMYVWMHVVRVLRLTAIYFTKITFNKSISKMDHKQHLCK